MAAQSMTGFGKGEAEGEKYKVSVEIKSVNHRFKDIRFKMGSVLNSIELPMKKMLEAKFKRGSFDVYVNYKKGQEQSAFELDKEKVSSFLKELKSCADEAGVELAVNPTGFLKSDFAKEDEDKESELQELTLKAYGQALKALLASREEEGAKLVEKLVEHKDKYRAEYNKVAGLKDSYQDKVKEKLLARFSQEKPVQMDEQRFNQEVIYYLEKLDIDEEVNRIAIHLDKLEALLKSEEESGRQIDFLMQELNRETNTIGSKSASTDISESVVQMKAQLEKIREQALNME